MKKMIAAAILSTLAVIGGCGENNPSSSSPVSPEYYPMQVGSWWNYDYSVIELEPDSGLSYEGSRHYEVLSQEDSTYMVALTQYYWLWNHYILADTLVSRDTLNVMVTSDSVTLISSDSTYNCKILDLPLEEGKTWDGVCTVLDLDAHVETPAGTFENCAEVLEYWENQYFCYYHKMYCPDIGLVEFNAYDVYPDPNNPDLRVDIYYELTGSNYL